VMHGIGDGEMVDYVAGRDFGIILDDMKHAFHGTSYFT